MKITVHQLFDSDGLQRLTPRRRLSGSRSVAASVNQPVASCHLSLPGALFRSVSQFVRHSKPTSQSVCRQVSSSRFPYSFFCNLEVSLKVVLQAPYRSVSQFVSHSQPAAVSQYVGMLVCIDFHIVFLQVDAVIDKDFTAAKIAQLIDADVFMIVTDTDGI